ncbi:MAG: type II toxin-antitoxin system HicB family antitoxin [candidate division Zixibacteria bacterium]|nr:type II toxin-antitoxin system HicB family antitoxin [candidate division Zixibacteria bacterium]
MKYSIIIERGRESEYVAFCPTLRGCVSQGVTKREAIQNLKKAIQDYIACLMEDGLVIHRH